FDHIDKKGLNVIENGSKIVSHKNACKLLKKKSDIDTTYLEWMEKKSFVIKGYNIEVEAIKAIHGMNLLAKILMGGVNGYLITIHKGSEKKTIYVTSDAVYSDDIVNTLKNKNIDILVANLGQAKSKMIGGPFTMNVDMLNKFIVNLNPTVVLPIHTNDFAHFETTKSDLARIINKNKLRILENGESTKIV
ncbi:MAG: MBL fold metallo-hydrolase, partial [Clostridium sp.]